MAIRPEISLAVRAPDVGQIFNNASVLARGFQDSSQRRAQAPIQNRLLESRADLGEANVSQAQRLGRATDIAFGAGEILPDLKTRNYAAVATKLAARRQRLVDEKKSTETTDEAIAQLNTNPEALLQNVQQIVSVAQQQGILNPSGGGQTAKLQELERFRSLPENTDEEKTFKKQFGQAIGAIQKRATIEERVDAQTQLGNIKSKQDITTARGTEEAKLSEQIKKIPERERVQFLAKNRSVFEGDIAESRAVLDEIDRAIEIWETAPGTISGPFASRFSALSDETQELESILAGLGIDRLSNFKGATSERELATAFRAGASIEQNKVAGIRRLKKQRRDITRNNDRLGGLLNQAKGLQRLQPEPAQVESAPDFDESLLEFMTPEERALFNGS